MTIVSEQTGNTIWNGFNLNFSTNKASIYAFKVHRGKLYIGTDFSLNGRNCLSRYSINNDIPVLDSGWNPNIQSSVYVNKIHADGDEISFSGAFSRVGNQQRDNFAVVKENNASLTDCISNFSTSPGADPIGNKFPIVSDEKNYYSAGSFTNISRGTSAIFQIDENNNLKLSRGLHTNGAIKTICSDENGGFYIGGDFTYILGSPRSYIAHIGSDGKLSQWSPTLDGSVTKVFKKGNYLYAVGRFVNVNNLFRECSVRFLVDTGAVDTDFVANFRGGRHKRTEVFTVIANDKWVYFGLVSKSVIILRGRRGRYTWSYNSLQPVQVTDFAGGKFSSFNGVFRISAVTGRIDTKWQCYFTLSGDGNSANYGRVNDIQFHPNDETKIFVCGAYNRAAVSKIVSGGRRIIQSTQYKFASQLNAPEESGEASFVHWGVKSDMFRVDGRRMSYSSETLIQLQEIKRIVPHGDSVYVGGCSTMWGPRHITNQVRSSKIAKFPLVQDATNFAKPDPNFTVNYSGTSKVDFGGLSQKFSCSDIHILDGRIHFTINTQNLVVNGTGNLFNGHAILNLDTGLIEKFFSPPIDTREVSFVRGLEGYSIGNFIVCSQHPVSDIKTSLVQINKDPNIPFDENSPLKDYKKLYEEQSGTTIIGTGDSKISIIKVDDNLFVFSSGFFSRNSKLNIVEPPSNRFIRKIELRNNSTEYFSPLVVKHGPFNIRDAVKIGDKIIIVGSEMTRDQSFDYLSEWGDFVDHGAPTGRKVIYFKLKD